LTSFIAKVIAAKFHSLAVTEVAGPTLFIAWAPLAVEVKVKVPGTASGIEIW
jgi:hypothetical protein